METAFSLLIGIGLAAAAGFRVFVPLLLVGLAQRFDLLALAGGFDWMGSTPALIAFGAATLLEVLAYYIPWVDNLLDTVASPAAVLAGVVLAASVLTDIEPLTQWGLAVVAGGGTAGIFQGLTVGTRGLSSAATGGLANPLVSTAEMGASAVLSVLAIIVPVAAVVVALILLLVVARKTLFRRQAA